MEVDDYNLSSTEISSSDSQSAANPVYSFSPILSLGSLLGTATAAEYSQLQGYKSVSMGRLKCCISILAFSQVETYRVRQDHLIMCQGLLIAPSDDAQGTPNVGMPNMNPFLSSVVPGAAEDTKNPWDEGMDAGDIRWVWLRRHIFWYGDCFSPLARMNQTWEMQFRTRRGYRLKETETLYLAEWYYADHGSAEANDVRIEKEVHIGVPRRFNS